MATVNIGQGNAGDQFYRYKMPKLQAKVAVPQNCRILGAPSPACQAVYNTMALSAGRGTRQWNQDVCGEQR